MAVKYYKFGCFQLYEFNTMNSYVTNQKKLAIEKHTNSYETAFAYRKKKNLSTKKGLPLEPRYAGIYKFTTKIFQTPTQKGG
jgi:hypothetical protein